MTRQQVRRTEIESQRSARAEASIAGSDLPGAAVRGVVRSEAGQQNQGAGKHESKKRKVADQRNKK